MTRAFDYDIIISFPFDLYKSHQGWTIYRIFVYNSFEKENIKSPKVVEKKNHHHLKNNFM